MNDLDVAVAAAHTGGAIIAAAFGGTYAADYKGRHDPVTKVDHASEEAIIAVIKAERPDDSVVAEESGGLETSGRHWLIDPLDGTVNFVHGIPQIAVSIGLWEGGTSLAGVVFDPLRDELFTAETGKGARLNGAEIAVSDTTELDRAVVATGFPYDHADHAGEYADALGGVLATVNGLRRFGSAALDLCWVAAGRFDAFWELGVAPWDQAAGIVIVREAGGRVTDPFGTDSLPGTRLVVATNGLLHDGITGILAPLVPERLR